MIYIHLIPGCHKSILEHFKRIGNKFNNYTVDDYSDGLVITGRGSLAPTFIPYNKDIDFYIDEKNLDFGYTSHN